MDDQVICPKCQENDATSDYCFQADAPCIICPKKKKGCPVLCEICGEQLHEEERLEEIERKRKIKEEKLKRKNKRNK